MAPLDNPPRVGAGVWEVSEWGGWDKSGQGRMGGEWAV